jgi:hypothetical protein
MTQTQLSLVLLNALGGAAVLLSYVYVAFIPAELRDGLWGGLPDGFRTPYTVTMFLAAAGYFPLTYKLLFDSDIDASSWFGIQASFLIPALYFLLLLPSAAWVPLTVEMLKAPSPLTWFAVRSVLILVGIGTVGLLSVATAAAMRDGGVLAWSAVVGGAFLCLQTAILDAAVWPVYFPN